MLLVASTHIKEARAECHDGDEEGGQKVGHHLGEELPAQGDLHLDALLAVVADKVEEADVEHAVLDEPHPPRVAQVLLAQGGKFAQGALGNYNVSKLEVSLFLTSAVSNPIPEES